MTDDKIPTESYLALVDSAHDKAKVRIAELEEMRDTAVYLFIEAMFHLREGRIKRRRKLADSIEQVLEEWRSK